MLETRSTLQLLNRMLVHGAAPTHMTSAIGPVVVPAPVLLTAPKLLSAWAGIWRSVADVWQRWRRNESSDNWRFNPSAALCTTEAHYRDDASCRAGASVSINRVRDGLALGSSDSVIPSPHIRRLQEPARPAPSSCSFLHISPL